MTRSSANARTRLSLFAVAGFGVLALAGACTQPPPPAPAAVPAPAQDSAAIGAILTKLDDDWSAAAATKDTEKVASYYADDAVAYAPNEPVAMGKDAAKKVWAAYFAAPNFVISWKTTHAGATGDLGYTSGTYEDSFTGPDGKPVREVGKYLCVWKKQADGSWKAIHDMWNADAK